MSNQLLKFRVWNSRYKYFVYPETQGYMNFSINLFGAIYQHSGDYDYVEDSESWKAQQFTGLTDKNNKGVYCGDIIQFKVFEDWGDYTGQIVKYYIDWCEYDVGWRAFTKGMKDKNYAGIKIEEHFEVIGNIFETPEILE